MREAINNKCSFEQYKHRSKKIHFAPATSFLFTVHKYSHECFAVYKSTGKNYLLTDMNANLLSLKTKIRYLNKVISHALSAHLT